MQVEGSYYAALPAAPHSEVTVRIYEREIEILDAAGTLLRRHEKSLRKGAFVMAGSDRLFNPSRETARLLARVRKIGPHTAALAQEIFARLGRPGQRAIYGLANLPRTYPRADIEAVCARLHAAQCVSYAAVRRALERQSTSAARAPTHAVGPGHPGPHRVSIVLGERTLRLTRRRTPMAMSITELERALRALRLSGMGATLQARALQVASHEMDFIEAFSWLVQDELDRRRSRLLDRRYTLSGLTERKDLKGFDWSYNPKLPKREVLELGTLKFIDARADALLIGPPGTGKSHAAKALALLAVQRGYKVLYREAHQLIEDLTEARELGEMRKVRTQLKSGRAAAHRRPVPAQAPRPRGRRARRRAHESLREVLDDRHLEPTARRLGTAARRRGASSPRCSTA